MVRNCDGELLETGSGICDFHAPIPMDLKFVEGRATIFDMSITMWFSDVAVGIGKEVCSCRREVIKDKVSKSCL